MLEDQIIIIFCPDCRGRFDAPRDDFREEEVLECDLCGAEILVVDEEPPRVKLFSEEDDF